MQTRALCSAVRLKESAATAWKTFPINPYCLDLEQGSGGNGFSSSPKQFCLVSRWRGASRASNSPASLELPLQEIWGKSSQHFSIILRTLILQHFTVTHIPTVAKRPLCFQNWEKFNFSLFLPSTSSPEAQRTGLEANLT